jgi:hypothetical protein
MILAMSSPSNPDDQNPFASPAPPAYQSGGYPPGNPQQMAMNLAIGSLVTGLMGNISCFCCLAAPMPMLAIGLGIAALLNKPDSNAKVIAIIGIALGALTMLVTLAWYALAIFGGALRH